MQITEWPDGGILQERETERDRIDLDWLLFGMVSHTDQSRLNCPQVKYLL